MESSKVKWFPLDPITRSEYVMTVNRSFMDLADSQFDLAGLLKEKESGFFSEWTTTRQIPYLTNWRTALTFEMSVDRRVYFRKVYSTLDFLSDVGGIYSALAPILTFFLIIINFWSSYQFLMGDLFFGGNQESKINFKNRQIGPRGSNNVQWSCCSSLYITSITMCGPKKCCCCRTNRNARLKSKGLRMLLDEMTITNIIR